MYKAGNRLISGAVPLPFLMRPDEQLAIGLPSACVDAAANQAAAKEKTEIAEHAAAAYAKEIGDWTISQHNSRIGELPHDKAKFEELPVALSEECDIGGGGRVGDTIIVDTRKSRHLICEQGRFSASERGRQWRDSFSQEAELDGGQSRSWLTQQQAAEEFCLSVQTLRDAVDEGFLTVEKRPNPYGATYAPMRLYRRGELRRLAFQTWGDEAGLEEERERRREQRWQSRQQRTVSLISSSATLEDSSNGAGARGGRSLPDLKTFLRSKTRPKRGQTQQKAGGVSRVKSAAHRSGKEPIDRRNAAQTQERGRRATLQLPGTTAHLCSRWEKVTGNSIDADSISKEGHIDKPTHLSSSKHIAWEEI